MPTVERCPSQTTHVSLPICRYSRFWIRCCWIRMRSVSVNVGFVMTAAELISLSTSFRSLGPNRSPLQAGNLRETSCGPESPERCRDQHGLRACGRHSTTAARRALHRCSTRKPLAFPSVPDPGSIDAVVAALVEQSFVFGVKQHRRQHAVFLAMVVLPLILVRIRDMFLAPFVIDTPALAELHEPVAAIPRPEGFDIFRQILIAADEIDLLGGLIGDDLWRIAEPVVFPRHVAIFRRANAPYLAAARRLHVQSDQRTELRVTPAGHVRLVVNIDPFRRRAGEFLDDGFNRRIFSVYDFDARI